MVYVAIFGLTILLSLVRCDTSLCFVVSMLVISFMCGYQHLIIYMAALVLTSLYFMIVMEVLISLTSVVMMQVLMSFKFIKSKYITLIIGLVSLIYLYIYNYSYVEILVILGFTLLHSILA